jgi:hypothetical protein
MCEIYFSNIELLRIPGFDFPYTVILISPYNFISALTSVLIERLLRLKTSRLYLENLYYHNAYLYQLFKN